MLETGLIVEKMNNRFTHTGKQKHNVYCLGEPVTNRAR